MNLQGVVNTNRSERYFWAVCGSITLVLLVCILPVAFRHEIRHLLRKVWGRGRRGGDGEDGEDGDRKSEDEDDNDEEKEDGYVSSAGRNERGTGSGSKSGQKNDRHHRTKTSLRTGWVLNRIWQVYSGVKPRLRANNTSGSRSARSGSGADADSGACEDREKGQNPRSPSFRGEN